VCEWCKLVFGKDVQLRLVSVSQWRGYVWRCPNRECPTHRREICWMPSYEELRDPEGESK